MTNKIKLLSDRVINQIAAGEVVDRPASVVKELFENSLDAAAARVAVEVEQGGRRLIKVTDDGAGMSREDALLALERHATSKIKESRDLFAISSLGFRGEALPSIASVCELVLVTREPGSDAGIEIRADAGAIRSVSETGAPPGTEVSVCKLFSKVPARRKFIKSVPTEFGHISTLVSNMALARPDVHVTLIHNHKTVYDLPASPDLSGRLRNALGQDAADSLAPVDRTFTGALSKGELKVWGLVSLPSYTRSSTRSLHVFVNRRFVRDRLINHAVFEAYRTLVPKGRYPLVVLFVDLPPEAVDVNVHPAKHEIRFRDQAGVHQSVIEAIQGSLEQADRRGAFRTRLHDTRKEREEEPQAARGQASDPETISGAARAIERFHQKTETQMQKPGYGPSRPRVPGPGTRSRESDTGQVERHHRAGPSREREAPSMEGLTFSELRVIGQAGGSYILAESSDSLVIIDQHAAHERVMFERLRAQFDSERVLTQPLLFPATMELTLEEAQEVHDNQELLMRLGLEVEPFGGNTVVVKALPALLAGVDPEKLVLDVVDRLSELAGGSALDRELEEVFAVMACHSVVRAHEAMSIQEIKSLLRSMDEIKFPGHCPHGRDAVVRIRMRDMDKWFGR